MALLPSSRYSSSGERGDWTSSAYSMSVPGHFDHGRIRVSIDIVSQCEVMLEVEGQWAMGDTASTSRAGGWSVADGTVFAGRVQVAVRFEDAGRQILAQPLGTEPAGKPVFQ